uniref:hypothetical protein n=1 Tax=uncultured Jannaschia sp. TaxID=293347 RepID=UPI002614793F
ALPKRFDGDFIDDRDDLDEFDDETDDDTIEGEAVELDDKAANAPKRAPAISGVNASKLPASSSKQTAGKVAAVPDSTEPASTANDAGPSATVTPDTDKEGDPHRQRLIKGMEQLSLNADDLTNRLQKARRKNSKGKNKTIQTAPSENDQNIETPVPSEVTALKQTDASDPTLEDGSVQSLDKTDDTTSRLLLARALNKKRSADQTN